MSIYILICITIFLASEINYIKLLELICIIDFMIFPRYFIKLIITKLLVLNKIKNIISFKLYYCSELLNFCVHKRALFNDADIKNKEDICQ